MAAEEVIDSVYSKFVAEDMEGMKELMDDDFFGGTNGSLPIQESTKIRINFLLNTTGFFAANYTNHKSKGNDIFFYGSTKI